MKFNQLVYTRPDMDAAMVQLAKLTENFQNCNSGEEQYEILKEFEKMTSAISTMGSLSNIRHTINTTDSFYAEEKAYFDKVNPVFNEKSLELKKAIVDSKFKDYLQEKIGEVPFINAQLALKSNSPEITALVQEENALKSQYEKLYASAKVEFDGKTMPLPMLGPYKESLDRETRRKAFVTEGQFFDDHKDELDELFDKLVKNRTKQAQILGYDNYLEIGYMRRLRNSYNIPEVTNFRNQVMAEIVPVVEEIRTAQKKRTGMDKLAFYDLPYTFKDGAPTPQGTSDQLMAHGRTMYHEMMEETKEFIDLMYDNDLFDVLSKEGKRPGGYCSSLSDYKYPFVFSNFNGTAGDVDVLTHEIGHAFAGYRAFQNFELPNIANNPSYEICEIHSMAMEFLTAPWHHLFFKEDTKKYQLSQVEASLIFIPYGCLVDHFQEEIYKNPDMTPAERNKLWEELDSKYRPTNDYEDLPFYSRGAAWQRQLHVYLYPFYYIDYCLAQTMALQFFAEFLKDKDTSYKRYVNLVDFGGSKTFVDLVKSTGFASPFDNGSIKSIVDTIKLWLKDNQI